MNPTRESGQEFFEISRVGLGGVGSSRIGSVRFGSVWVGSVWVGSGRVGSGRVGSEVTFKLSRIGSGYPYPTPPDPPGLTREV